MMWGMWGMLQPLAAPASTVAGMVTAVATLVTALGGMALAVSVLIPILRNTKITKTEVSEVKGEVIAVHTIVNQQRTDQMRYNIALMELLKKHGIEPPIDQSLPVTGQRDAKADDAKPKADGGGRHRRTRTGSSLDPRPESTP